MSDKQTNRPSRRGVLGSAAAVLGAGVAGVLARPASAAADPEPATGVQPLAVRRRFQLLDRASLQRFRLSSTKPPIYHDGITYPASERQGPDNGTWITFNDENQDEKGGLTASTTGESLSFDWANAQAVTLLAGYEGDVGYTELSMNQQPDPTIPITEVTAADTPQRVLLGTDNQGSGALLYLFDSVGRPRITIQVDGDDVPRIQILDAEGEVVAQLPADAPPAKRAPRPARDRLAHLRPGLRPLRTRAGTARGR